MTIRTYKTWRWYDSAMTVVSVALITFGALAVWRSTEYPPAARWASLLVPAAAIAFWLRLYQTRRAFAARIAWTTRQGVWVVPGEARDWLAQHRTLLETSIEDAMAFWAQRFHEWPAVEDYVNGSAIQLDVRTGPLIDRRHGVVAKGLTYPKRVVVAVPMAVLHSYPEAVADFWATLRHELGHLALNAIPSVPQDTRSHHEQMQAAHWKDL